MTLCGVWVLRGIATCEISEWSVEVLRLMGRAEVEWEVEIVTSWSPLIKVVGGTCAWRSMLLMSETCNAEIL